MSKVQTEKVWGDTENGHEVQEICVTDGPEGSNTTTNPLNNIADETRQIESRIIRTLD